MSKRGRPIKEDARRNNFILRLNDEELARIDRLCKVTGKSRSAIVRECVTTLFDAMKKGEWRYGKK